MYKLIKTQGTARRGEFHTVHGVVQTPAFMNVATAAAIKGGLSAKDLEDIRCQVMLSTSVYNMEKTYSYRQWWISGVFSFCTEKN